MGAEEAAKYAAKIAEWESLQALGKRSQAQERRKQRS